MQNTNKYQWKVVPSNQPTVIRSCPKCGGHSEYENSGNFRVNANQSQIDVWLIYQCKKCKNTWNMEILSRVHSGSIEKELYLKFLNNDSDLARQYAFDTVAHSRNHSVLNFENMNFDIVGDCFSPSQLKEELLVELVCEHPMDIRLDKILCRQLGLPRVQIKKMSNEGRITGDGIKDITKARVRNGLKILFR
jgi:hypothetical protein